MNEKNPEEIRYRRLAFQLFDQESSATAILARIPRSRSWLGKWKQRFEHEGGAAVDSRAKAPHHSPPASPSAAVKVVVRIRQRLAQSALGHVGAHALRQEVLRHRLLTPVPSVRTIKGWLKAAALIDSPAEPDKEPDYPVPHLRADGVLFACDWTER
jgi:hypothetical protein